MGLYDPQMRVGTSGTQPALGRNYATNAATAGRVLTSQGDDLPPAWAAAAPGVAPIAQTLVVDAVNFSATPTGTLGAPFQTCQAAINAAVALGWTFVQLLIAPATYADPILVPANFDIVFHGWDEFAGPTLGGDITLTGGIGSSNLTVFTNCVITAANIIAANPATQDIDVSLISTFNSAAVTGFNVFLRSRWSTQGGNVTANGGLFTSWDGFSWARTLQVAPVIAPPGFTRQFLDAGHDIYQRALTINGLAIGTTGFVTMAVSTGVFVRTEDQAQVKVLDPAIQDFICGVHGVGPGSVTCWITNLSRVSTNFNEAIQLLIHHNDMIAEPAP
jgi:hypothetical protein